MNCNEVRKKFLEFFQNKKHQIVSSAPLQIENDPTLLFTNAGMNQFKDVFTGADKRDYDKATTSQKCLRISGKHNDFENVGITARHHTFFEMLGNFSFGDYFKKEAIEYAWEFSTEVLKLDKSKIWVTIFEEDDEAKELWIKHTDIKPERVLKMGADENYWSMGAKGPCGPCSEIHYYVGPEDREQTEADFRKDDGSYLEFWNLVFMQFNKEEDGTLSNLPKPSVDTGMGLERMTAIVSKAESNYECDELKSILKLCEQLSGFKYKGGRFGESLSNNDPQYLQDVAMRVLADHSRAMTFLIAEGLTPGSDGRSYVLRRLIRRAVRHARVLKFNSTILDKTCKIVIDTMGSAYPELKEKEEIILKVVEAEELKFKETIESGMQILENEVKKIEKGKELSGEVAFLLHDTYGFPVDLTADALKTYGLSINHDEFKKAMQSQKERSRGVRADKNIKYEAHNINASSTTFVGYQKYEHESELEQIISEEVNIKRGDTCILIFKETPFYAESGGQVSDTGKIVFKNSNFKVLNVEKVNNKYFLHTAKLIDGELSEKNINEKAELLVDINKRSKASNNHSATHLVHAALRKVLGSHVKQAGSRVAENSFRFDYSHFETVTREQLIEIEKIVNEEILKNNQISTIETTFEDAKEKGALAFFGDKYGDKVRMVSIGENSKELCGGTHAKQSGDIGLVHIVNESSIAAGVRRIECVSGMAVSNSLWEKEQREQALATLLKTNQDGLIDRVEKLLEKQKELESELQGLKIKNINDLSADYLSKVEESPSGVKVLAVKVEDNLDNNELRKMVDSLRIQLKSGVVALVSNNSENKATLVSGVTSDLTKTIHVGNIVKQVASAASGKGGGRADFAQAGGLEASKTDEALKQFMQAIN
jgi:alanyl-tRNA synthetase